MTHRTVVAAARAVSARSLDFMMGRLRALTAHVLLAVVVAATLAVSLTACGGHDYYKFPEYTFAGRPVPPSLLAERVMISVTSGVGGGLVIVDALRDIRNNIQNTKAGFSIAGYSGADPTTIVNFPAELRGYVYSGGAMPTVSVINYSTEAATGPGLTITSTLNSFAVSSAFLRVFGAQEQSSQLVVQDNQTGGVYGLNLPNVYQVATNTGNTVALAMVRNSNTLYRVIKLNINSTNPPGAVDCEPNVLPVYCVVPVPGTFDRPIGATFSADGSVIYVMNCGAECGGGQNGGSGISVIPQGLVQVNLIPTSTPYPPVVSKTIPIPGGATASLTDGTTLYISGQQLQPDGLFEGFLTLLPLGTMVPGPAIPISDGNHSKMLFADGPTTNGVVQTTLWIGSQQCSNGERAKLGLNINCLTRVLLDGSTSPVAGIIPANVVQGGATTVAYPNQNDNLYYYGSLTGLCWVQSYFKVYTAYGGQVHIFSTVDGSEIDNTNVTVQGTALDVAYLDATTDEAN